MGDVRDARCDLHWFLACAAHTFLLRRSGKEEEEEEEDDEEEGGRRRREEDDDEEEEDCRTRFFYVGVRTT